MPLYKQLPDFSTADAELLTLLFQDGNLVVEFKDWQERHVHVTFPDAVAFSWGDEPVLPDNVRDDCCYEVLDSDWLGTLVEHGAIDDPKPYKHYLLCFNACSSCLRVASLHMVIAPEQPSPC